MRFIRQGQDTCAPATLSTLSQFWGKPAVHLEVAEEICYAGTPIHAARAWAERQGWSVREFTINWEIAVALLERGVPFAMFTMGSESGHAQTVAGYDEARKSLIVRDSNFHELLEYDCERLLAEQRLNGPPGLVFVPSEKAALLEGITYPDGELREQVYRFHVALAAYRREEAAAVLRAMQEQNAAHGLTLSTELLLALYDENQAQALKCLEQLLGLHPENEQLLLQKLSLMGEREQRSERLGILEERCARPQCSPKFLFRYATELSTDARELELAGSWARRALRRSFSERTIECMANLLWSSRATRDGFELFRLAACLNDKDESAARTYFNSARFLNESESALAFLKGRFNVTANVHAGRRFPFIGHWNGWGGGRRLSRF